MGHEDLFLFVVATIMGLPIGLLLPFGSAMMGFEEDSENILLSPLFYALVIVVVVMILGGTRELMVEWRGHLLFNLLFFVPFGVAAWLGSMLSVKIVECKGPLKRI